MASIDDEGGPAFPVPAGGQFESSAGMTMRDHFAAMAMQAILASDRTYDGYDQVAEWAYGAADAMLAERGR